MSIHPRISGIGHQDIYPVFATAMEYTDDGRVDHTQVIYAQVKGHDSPERQWLDANEAITREVSHDVHVRFPEGSCVDWLRKDERQRGS